MGEIFSVEVWRQSLVGSIERFGEAVGSMLPAIVGTILILLIGWGLSRIVQAIAQRALHRVGIDRAAAQFRVTDALRRANIVAPASAIVARVLFWLLMLTFVLAGAETLGLNAVTVTIDRVIAYLPNVVGAALIVVAGFVAGRMLQRFVGSGGAMAGLPQAEKLGGVARGVVLVVAAVVAAEQLGLKTDALVIVVTVFTGAVALTMGLAFALGARTLVTHILAGHYLRQSLAGGKTVEIAGRKGTVESVGAVNTVLREGDRSWLIPNATVLEGVVAQ